MAKYKLEYIWLDGYEPIPKHSRQDSDQGIRQLSDVGANPKLGHSTEVRPKQAEGHAPIAFLSLSRFILTPTKNEAAIVMCEVLCARRQLRIRPTLARPSLMTPTLGSVSSRNIFFTRTADRSGSPKAVSSAARHVLHGCGLHRVGNIAREIVKKHLDLCLVCRHQHEGINAEVAKGQWEFQIFGKGSRRAADDVWVARYLMARLGETYGVDSNPLQTHPGSDWIGMVPACTATSRPNTCAKSAGKNISRSSWPLLKKHMDEHIAVYGPDNHLRLTGLHETQSIDKFNYGLGESRRLRPHSAQLHQQRLQGIPRRSPSQFAGDPYKIASRILQTIATVPDCVRFPEVDSRHLARRRFFESGVVCLWRSSRGRVSSLGGWRGNRRVYRGRARASATTRSGVTPSASPSKLIMSRCRRAGNAQASMSSLAT